LNNRKVTQYICDTIFSMTKIYKYEANPLIHCPIFYNSYSITSDVLKFLLHSNHPIQILQCLTFFKGLKKRETMMFSKTFNNTNSLRVTTSLEMLPWIPLFWKIPRYNTSCHPGQQSLIVADLDHGSPLDLENKIWVDLVLDIDVAQMFESLILDLG
jgi:hypothetical protein